MYKRWKRNYKSYKNSYPNFDGSKYLCPLCSKELIDILNRRKETSNE